MPQHKHVRCSLNRCRWSRSKYVSCRRGPDPVPVVSVVLSGWLSWFGNSIVLFVLYRQRATLQPTDYLTFNLAVSDASISVFGYSRGIVEVFKVFQNSEYIISSIWTCEVPNT